MRILRNILLVVAVVGILNILANRKSYFDYAKKVYKTVNFFRLSTSDKISHMVSANSYQRDDVMRLVEQVDLTHLDGAQHQPSKLIDLARVDKLVSAVYAKHDFEYAAKYLDNLLKDDSEPSSFELYVAYCALSNISGNIEAKKMNQVLDKWCESAKNSHFAYAARGAFLVELAWEARGGGWGIEVKQSARDVFREKLELAKKDLLYAFKLNPNDPNPMVFMIDTAKGLSSSRAEVASYFEAGKKVCPWHFGLYRKMLSFKSPKWGGSLEAMFELSGDCTALAVKYPLLGIIMVRSIEEAGRFSKGEKKLVLEKKVQAIIEKIYKNYFLCYPNDMLGHFNYAYNLADAENKDMLMREFEYIGYYWSELFVILTNWDSFKHFAGIKSYYYYEAGADRYHSKNYKDAVPYFESIVSFLPTADAYYMLAVSCWGAGIIAKDPVVLAEAKWGFEQALSMDPNHKLAKKQFSDFTRLISHISKKENFKLAKFNGIKPQIRGQ